MSEREPMGLPGPMKDSKRMEELWRTVSHPMDCTRQDYLLAKAHLEKAEIVFRPEMSDRNLPDHDHYLKLYLGINHYPDSIFQRINTLLIDMGPLGTGIILFN